MKDKLLIATVIILGLIAYAHSQHLPSLTQPASPFNPSQTSKTADDASMLAPDTSYADTRIASPSGSGCTVDCSGHEAGYDWAETHNIDDEDDCDAAGDSHNSTSFAEGCKNFVNGNDFDEKGADADDGETSGDDQ